jgi:hypothetical protein
MEGMLIKEFAFSFDRFTMRLKSSILDLELLESLSAKCGPVRAVQGASGILAAR